MARPNRRDVLADQDVQVVHCINRSINIDRSINKANKHVVEGMAPFWRSILADWLPCPGAVMNVATDGWHLLGPDECETAQAVRYHISTNKRTRGLAPNAAYLVAFRSAKVSAMGLASCRYDDSPRARDCHASAAAFTNCPIFGGLASTCTGNP